MFQSSLLPPPSRFKKLTLMMEAVSSFETSVTTYQSPQYLIPEDLNFQPLTLLFGLQWKNKIIEIIFKYGF
jgi:hypothetical protein